MTQAVTSLQLSLCYIEINAIHHIRTYRQLMQGKSEGVIRLTVAQAVITTAIQSPVVSFLVYSQRQCTETQRREGTESLIQ